MVRLRSDRWYSSDGQNRSRTVVATQSTGSRRLISLCFLLALVVMMMQKAADPKHVSNAFRALGVPLEDRRAEGDSAQAANPLTAFPSQNLNRPATQVLATGESRWKSTCNDLVSRLLEGLTPKQIDAISQAWFELPEPRDAAATTKTRDELAQQTTQSLEQLSLTVPSNSDDDAAGDPHSWVSQFGRFQLEWKQMWGELTPASQTLPPAPSREAGESLAARSLSPEFEAALTAFLDSRLALNADDASPWTSAELVYFNRLLQRASGSGRKNPLDWQPISPPFISTMQLESEAKFYKNEMIRFRGSLRQAEFVERTTGFSNLNQPTRRNEGYWTFWLRGEDGSTQPIAIYTTTGNASSIAKSLERKSPRTDDFPEIELVGIVGKRLAYAAAAGVQVAPTLFASALQEQKVAPNPMALQSEKSRSKDFSTALMIGALAAGLIAIPILANWRRVSPRRAAKSRRDTKKPPGGTPTATALLCILIGPALLSSKLSAQQEASPTANSATERDAFRPPWSKAESVDAQRQKLLRERLAPTLTSNGLSALADHLAAETAIPDEPLKIIRTIEQIGWQHALQLPEPIVGDGFSLSKVPLSGIARSAVPVQLTDAQVSWFQSDDTPRLFLVQVSLGPITQRTTDSPEPLAVLCSQVPAAWLGAQELQQPVQFDALVLKRTDSKPMICGFASRANWRWNPELDASGFEPKPELSSNMRRLAGLGWNLSLLEPIAAHSQNPIQSSETESFYSLLHLLDKHPEFESNADRQTASDPMDILKDPIRSIGGPVRWRVRLVTGSVVQVSSQIDQELLGADHYYQFDGFVDIGNQVIRYQVAGDSSDATLTFEREFPVTIVMKGASEFVPKAAIAAGELSWPVGKYIWLEGCYYRLWSYESTLAQSKDARGRQAAPLVVGTRLRGTSPPVRSQAVMTGWFGYALCGAVLVIMAAILYSAAPKRRRARRPGQ